MINEDKLPEGWKLLKLGDISLKKAEYGSGAKAIDYDSNKPRYVRITDINEEGKLKTDNIVSPSEIEEKYFLREGDLLFARSGSVGRTYLYQNNDGICQYAGYLIRFQPDPKKIDRHYLSYVTKSPYFWNWVESKKKTMTISNINAKQYSSLRIPIPPLSIQHKIAELLEKAENLKEYRLKADNFTDTLFNSYFLELFGDPIKNPNEFETKKLKDLCQLKSGGTPSRKNKKFFQGDYPWITTVALGPKYIDKKDAAEFITSEAIAKSATKLIPKESILIGVRVGVGKASINKCDICTSQDVVSLIKIDDRLNKEFLLQIFRYYQKYFESQIRGATIKGITSSILKELDIILPPIALQNEYSHIVRQIEDLKTCQTQCKQQIEDLSNVLMQKAFKGELIC